MVALRHMPYPWETFFRAREAYEDDLQHAWTQPYGFCETACSTRHEVLHDHIEGETGRAGHDGRTAASLWVAVPETKSSSSRSLGAVLIFGEKKGPAVRNIKWNNTVDCT